MKIGFSGGEDSAARIASLQTGCPFQIKELFNTFGTLRQEKALHSALRVGFGRVRIPIPPNEWYPGRNPFFQSFLEHLKYGPDAGFVFLDKYNPAIKQPGKKSRGEPNIKWPLK